MREKKIREKSTGNHFATLLPPALLPAPAATASRAIQQLRRFTDLGDTLTFVAFLLFSVELAFLFFFNFCTTQLPFQLLACVMETSHFASVCFDGGTPSAEQVRVRPPFPDGRSQNIIVLCMPGEDLTQSPGGTEISKRPRCSLLTLISPQGTQVPEPQLGRVPSLLEVTRVKRARKVLLSTPES